MKQDKVINYPTEFLNLLDLLEKLLQMLILKIGAPIILFKNINSSRICNGTSITEKNMMNNIIKPTILNGCFKREDVLLPIILIFPTDVPFNYKRLLFRVRLAFPLTFNNAQEQSLQFCGQNLENPCFSHE